MYSKTLNYKKGEKTMNNISGKKVVIDGNQNGVIVGASQRYNGTWVVLIDGENKEIHDSRVKDLSGKYLPIVS